jgi:hypothetical protein
MIEMRVAKKGWTYGREPTVKKRRKWEEMGEQAAEI